MATHLTISKPSSSTVEQANYHHLVMDIAWFGVALASTTRFLQFYAIRMGATPMELGWLTALPSIVLVFATALSAWWRGRYHDSLQAIWLPSIGFRFVYLLPAFAPFFPEQWRTLWIILAATLPALPQGVASSIFLVMMRESIPGERLTPLLARRALALNVCLTIGVLGFGFWLENIPFPTNYQMMFIAAFGLSMVSQWHIGRIRQYEKTLPEKARRVTAADVSIRDLLHQPRFVSVIWMTMVTHIGFFSVYAVTPIRLESLGATEGFMATFGIGELIGGILAAVFSKHIVDRIGNRGLVTLGMMGTAVAAVIIGLAPNMWLTLPAAIITGASWTAAGVIGVLGFFAERTNNGDIKSTTLFNQSIFIGMFIGPLLGSSLVNGQVDVSVVLLIGAGLRALAALLSHLGLRVFGVSRVDPLHKAPAFVAPSPEEPEA